MTDPFVVIDGVKTYVTTAEKLAKDWQGKLMQFGSGWKAITYSSTNPNLVLVTLDFGTARMTFTATYLVLYRLSEESE